MKIKNIAAICKKNKTIVLFEKHSESGGKPEGIPIELADVIIRILDYCGYAGIDIEVTPRMGRVS